MCYLKVEAFAALLFWCLQLMASSLMAANESYLTVLSRGFGQTHITHFASELGHPAGNDSLQPKLTEAKLRKAKLR